MVEKKILFIIKNNKKKKNTFNDWKKKIFYLVNWLMKL